MVGKFLDERFWLSGFYLLAQRLPRKHSAKPLKVQAFTSTFEFPTTCCLPHGWPRSPGHRLFILATYPKGKASAIPRLEMPCAHTEGGSQEDTASRHGRHCLTAEYRPCHSVSSAIFQVCQPLHSPREKSCPPSGPPRLTITSHVCHCH
jgi:hypothetical protein